MIPWGYVVDAMKHAAGHKERDIEALKVIIDQAKDSSYDDYPPCETDWLARCLYAAGVRPTNASQ